MKQRNQYARSLRLPLDQHKIIPDKRQAMREAEDLRELEEDYPPLHQLPQKDVEYPDN